MSGAAADLWTFATQLYARPGIEAACIGLQERLGQDVDLLLLACWLGCRGVRLTADRLVELEAEVRPLRVEVIMPLRTIRRRIKDPILSPPFAAPLVDLRDRVKALELEGERLELLVLEERTRDLPADPAAADAALRANLGLFGEVDGDPDLGVLAAVAGR